MRAKNEVATKLLDKLSELGVDARPGYFNCPNYCVGIPVATPRDAVVLGTALGGGYGQIGWDRVGHQDIVVFRDALVSQ